MTPTIPPIHRVVTTFILTRATCFDSAHMSQPKVAIFHRCATMPTFPSHWAGISGTIEEGEDPYQAAQRELSEETNLSEKVNTEGGLYLDVPFISPHAKKQRTIRVYPFVVHVSTEISIELRGTEHDNYQMVSIHQLEEMKSVCVPGLLQAFHHATFGVYDNSVSPVIREWASDVKNGASVMTVNALQLLHATGDDWKTTARQFAMLRPSMVPICNVMHCILEHGKGSVTIDTLQKSMKASVNLGIRAIEEIAKELSQEMMIATFSRSGTIHQVLAPFLKRHKVVCAQSSPGNEGELMAKDLYGSPCICDLELHDWLTHGKIDLLIVGTDCIIQELNMMVNKLGTRELCQIAKKYQVPVICCADCWKIWGDKFAPPIEADLFELVPLDLITRIVVASDTDSSTGR